MRALLFSITLVAGFSPLFAQTSVALSSSANPAIFGQPLTLTATVTTLALSPAAIQGKVTFYDGANVLGTSVVNAGKAVFTTVLLPAGNRPLKAFYAGDAFGHAPATSPVLMERVTALTSNGFAPSNISATMNGITPTALATADFNGDGKADVVVWGPSELDILLGNGDGTFRISASYPNSGGYGPFLAVADFNQDGKPDVAYGVGPNSVAMLMGNGDGTFHAGVPYSAGQNLISATIGDFNGDGKPDLALIDAAGNVLIALGNGDGTFQPAVSYGLSFPPAMIATGDFNADGKADLVVGYYGGAAILRGNGDGTFQSPVTFPSGYPSSPAGYGNIAVADFNADGKLDLALPVYTPNGQAGVSVFMGNADGSFQPAVFYPTMLASSLAAGDFNGDGNTDLAVSEGLAVAILLGKGDGTFAMPLNQNTGLSPNTNINSPFPLSLAVADFDGNGLADIAFAIPQTLPRVGLLLGSTNPDLTLSLTQTGAVAQGQTGVSYTLSAQNAGFTTFNGPLQLNYSMGSGLTVTGVQSPGWTCTPSAPSSGSCTRPDGVASGQGYAPVTLTVSVSATAPYTTVSNAMLIFPSPAIPPVPTTLSTTILQTQVISFPAIPNHVFGDSPFSISASSSSGLPVTVLSSGNCSILGLIVTIDAAGTCTLTAKQPGSTFWAPASVARTFSISGPSTSFTLAVTPVAAQFGKPVTLTATVTPSRTLDKVTFYDGSTILGIVPLVAGTATFTTTLLAPGSHASLRAYYGGITTTTAPVTVTALATGGFAPPSQALPFMTGQNVAIGDFDGDGKADFVVAAINSAFLNVSMGNGDGSFRLAAPAYTGANSFQPIYVGVSDFNGDGKSDLIAVSPSGQFAILLGNGDGTFQNGVIYSSSAVGPLSPVIADFNGDGKADVAFASPLFVNGSHTVSIVLGNGDGTFSIPFILTVPETPWSLVAGDFNGDGKTDMAYAGDTTIGVLLGNGDGTFQPVIPNPITAWLNTTTLIAADLNNDGKLDLAFNRSAFVGVLMGNGDGTFRPERDYNGAWSSPGIFSLLATDLNQDQKADLLVASQTNLTALPGNGDGTFGAPLSYVAPFNGNPPVSMASADFNGDGRPDLVVGTINGSPAILLGTMVSALNITLSHTGNFTSGQNNATYSIVVQNTGPGATTGTVTVTGNFPPPLSVQSMTGTGWSCNVATAICTRGDSLVANSSYPPITVTVAVGSASGTVTSQATVSGGGAASATSTDTTVIVVTYLRFVTQPANARAGTALSNIAVRMEDGAGNIVPGSNLISLSSEPSGISASVNAVNGVAMFSGLVLNSPGTYTLTAYGAGLQPTISAPFVITVGPTVTISGQVTVSGTPLPGVNINLSGIPFGQTDATGSYSMLLPSTGNYTVSVWRAGYSFSPAVRFTNLISNQTVNFAGTIASPYEFYPVAPCRVADTRAAAGFPGQFGPPSMGAGTTRSFAVPAGACGIPQNAAAYSLNVTVVPRGYLGYLTIWPTGQPAPMVSTLNSYGGTVVANAAIVPAGNGGAVSIYVTDPADVLFDINGYFAPPSSSSYQFYPVTPCRVADTRAGGGKTGPFGPTTMTGGTQRSFPIPASPCGIPANAAAYSLNFTVVPKGPLGFLTAWPTGQPQPGVSTLNSYTGTVVANAAIVPAGANGAISVYVSDTTDVLFDINGYFAPKSNSGLEFYTATPCRVADTRVAAGFPAGFGSPAMMAGSQRPFVIPSGSCGIPAGAGAYSFNFTAVPKAPQLGIFITWPTGVSMPPVSTMNSYTGSVVANAAIVPAGSGGAISIYVTDPAEVLFDINGYFAP